MRFVDEVRIEVRAGNGGNGCMSFLRERGKPKGGPNGGDGGDGGSILFIARDSLGSLVDFRHRHQYNAENGQAGRSKNCSGGKGQNLMLSVPTGTAIHDEDSGELLGDLNRDAMQLMVAKGGTGGLGNSRFKSSTNRAPKQTTQGSTGEFRQLRLELNLMADVGLLGFPNAGKSTLLSALSNARPKIASYPFTTLWPGLGVVRLDTERHFVIADIPGLLPGAATGVGLGTRFLKHLSRTRLLLHLVEIQSPENRSAAEAVRALETELQQFDADLAKRERWLVLTKADLTDVQEQRRIAAELQSELNWQGPLMTISAATGSGLTTLRQKIMRWLEQQQTEQHPANTGDEQYPQYSSGFANAGNHGTQ